MPAAIRTSPVVGQSGCGNSASPLGTAKSQRSFRACATRLRAALGAGGGRHQNLSCWRPSGCGIGLITVTAPPLELSMLGRCELSLVANGVRLWLQKTLGGQYGASRLWTATRAGTAPAAATGERRRMVGEETIQNQRPV
jgi:hypothetical protein